MNLPDISRNYLQSVAEENIYKARNTEKEQGNFILDIKFYSKFKFKFELNQIRKEKKPIIPHSNYLIPMYFLTLFCFL